MNFLKKWNTYQKERFPVLIYGLYIFCIVFAVFCFSSYMVPIAAETFLEETNVNTLLPVKFEYEYLKLIPMFIFAFLQFLMVRIVDEFKDYEEDSKYRPYRPVPRGLVTLKELKTLFIICGVIQFAVSFAYNPDGLILLIGFWLFFALFSQDFFIKKFLDKHILITVLIDELLVAFLALYLSSFVGFVPVKFLWPILLATYIVSWIVEVARKVRCKEDEEEGVKTYTAVFGIPKATVILIILETILMLLQIYILGTAHLSWIVALYVLTNIINLLFIKNKDKKSAKKVELFANIFIVIVYLSMGLLIV